MHMKDQITAIAKGLNFDHIKFAKIDVTPRHEQFEAWLKRGEHADMHWMETNQDVRSDPRKRMEQLKSVMVLGVQHCTSDDLPAKMLQAT